MNAVLATATALLVLAVGWGSICRLRLLQTKTHKRVWVEAYYLMGGYAAAELYYLVVAGPRLSAVLGLATLACFLWGTRTTWRVKAPDGLLKDKG
jgi:hypothetical protein